MSHWLLTAGPVHYFYDVVHRHGGFVRIWLNAPEAPHSGDRFERATMEQQKEETTVPRYYVQQSRDAPGWKTVATAPSRLSALSLSGRVQKGMNDEQGPNKRYVRAMSRSALFREGGVDACSCAEDDLEGLELERATLRMRSQPV